MEKIEHLGIAVHNLQEAIRRWELILGYGPYKEELVESEGVVTSFFRIGESKIELLEARSPESPVTKFITKRGGGMHHVAIAVADIRAEMKRLQTLGIRLLNDEPRAGADNKLVCFLHPKDTFGVLIELCQKDSAEYG